MPSAAAEALFDLTVNGPNPDDPDGPFVDGRLNLTKLLESNYCFPRSRWSQLRKHADIDKIQASVSNFEALGLFGSIFEMPKFSPKFKGEVIVICNRPVYIIVDVTLQSLEVSREDLKQKLLDFISGDRDIPSTMTRVPHCVLSNDLLISSMDVAKLLEAAGVDVVTVLSFGMKSSLRWGQDMIQKIRAIDPRARIEFDIAVTAPPETMHWFSSLSGSGEKKNCIALNSENGVPVEPYVTLARMFDTDIMDGTKQNGLIGKCSNVSTLVTNMSAFLEMFGTVGENTVGDPGFFGTVLVQYNKAEVERILKFFSGSPDENIESGSGQAPEPSDNVQQSDDESDPNWDPDTEDPNAGGDPDPEDDLDTGNDIDPEDKYCINESACPNDLLHVPTKVKAYGSEFHRYKYRARESDFYNPSNVGKSKRRLEKVKSWAQDLIEDKCAAPGLRCEITYVVNPGFRPGSQSFSGAESMTVYEFFGHCFDDIQHFLENVEYVQMPSQHVGESTIRVANFAQSQAIPKELRVFYGREKKRITPPQRQMSNLVMMDCGLASDHGGQIVARDFRNNNGNRNTFRWFYAEKLRWTKQHFPGMYDNNPYMSGDIISQTAPPGQVGTLNHMCLVDPLFQEGTRSRRVSLFKAKAFLLDGDDVNQSEIFSSLEEFSQRCTDAGGSLFRHDLLPDEMSEDELEESDKILNTRGDPAAYEFFLKVRISRLPDPEEQNPFRLNYRGGFVAGAGGNKYALLNKMWGRIIGEEGEAKRKVLTNSPPRYNDGCGWEGRLRLNEDGQRRVWWDKGQLIGLEDYLFALGKREEAIFFFRNVVVRSENDGNRYVIHYAEGGRALISVISEADVLSNAWRRVMGCEGEEWQRRYVKPTGNEDGDDWPYTLERYALPLEERTDPCESEELIIDHPSGLEHDYMQSDGGGDGEEREEPDLSEKLDPCNDRNEALAFFRAVKVFPMKESKKGKNKKKKKGNPRQFYLQSADTKRAVLYGRTAIEALNKGWQRINGVTTEDYVEAYSPWRQTFTLLPVHERVQWWSDDDLLPAPGSEFDGVEEPGASGDEPDQLEGGDEPDQLEGNRGEGGEILDGAGAEFEVGDEEEEEETPRTKPTSADKMRRRVIGGDSDDDDSDDNNAFEDRDAGEFNLYDNGEDDEEEEEEDGDDDDAYYDNAYYVFVVVKKGHFKEQNPRTPTRIMENILIQEFENLTWEEKNVWGEVASRMPHPPNEVARKRTPRVSIDLIDGELRDFEVGDYDLRAPVDDKLTMLAGYCEGLEEHYLDGELRRMNVDKEIIRNMSRKEKRSWIRMSRVEKEQWIEERKESLKKSNEEKLVWFEQRSKNEAAKKESLGKKTENVAEPNVQESEFKLRKPTGDLPQLQRPGFHDPAYQTDGSAKKNDGDKEMLSDLRENARIVKMVKNRKDYFQVVKKNGAPYRGSNDKEGLLQRVCDKLREQGITNWREVIRTNQDEDHSRKKTKSGRKRAREKGDDNFELPFAHRENQVGVEGGSETRKSPRKVVKPTNHEESSDEDGDNEEVTGAVQESLVENSADESPNSDGDDSTTSQGPDNVYGDEVLEQCWV